MKTKRFGVFAAVVAALVLGGCATSGIPRELADARTLRDEAFHGPAAVFERPLVDAAEQSLKEAEEAAKKDPGSAEAIDTAYIAKRRMEIAIARGNIHEVIVRRDWDEAALRAEHRARLERNAYLAQKQAEDFARIGAVHEGSRGLVLSLSGAVLFPVGRSTLLPDAARQLDQVAATLKQAKDKQITVEGHTDSRGNPRLNRRLSQKRADAVVEYLVAQGVPREQMVAVGRAAEEPVADNTTENGRATNRRVELVISPSASPASTGTGGSGQTE